MKQKSQTIRFYFYKNAAYFLSLVIRIQIQDLDLHPRSRIPDPTSAIKEGEKIGCLTDSHIRIRNTDAAQDNNLSAVSDNDSKNNCLWHVRKKQYR